MGFGTLTIADLQATANNQNVVEFGEDRTWDAIHNTLEAHNMLMGQMVEPLVEVSTDRQRRYGGPDDMAMEDLDELGTPDAQKITAGSNVAFPLRGVGAALQWSYLYFLTHTPAELAAQMAGIMAADVRRINRDIKRALFLSSNYTFTDRRVDNVSLGVKRLVNADSAPIPIGPNGETFTASSHTHYLARAGGAWAATDLDALILTVVEHFNEGDVRLFINQAQEAAISAFTGFIQYLTSNVIPADTSARIDQPRLDVVSVYNRDIGEYKGIPISVRPWVPSGYVLCLIQGPGIGKPLVFRVRGSNRDSTGAPMQFQDGAGRVQTFGGLNLTFDNELNPLRAKGYGREFGVGVWNRIAAAVQYTGNTSYTDPTIAA